MNSGCLNPLSIWKTRYHLPFVKRSVSVGMTVIVLLLVLIALVRSLAAGDKAIVCARCHEMAPRFRSWAVSDHRKTPCSACHVNTGLDTMFRLKYLGAKMERTQQPSAAGAVSARVPDENCQRCHTSMPDWLSEKNLRVSHQKHCDRGLSCTLCHITAGHKPADGQSPRPGHSVCFQCHNGRQAPADCELCHPKPIQQTPAAASASMKRGPHPAGFLKVHSAAARKNLASCQSCHTNQYCAACHTQSIPATHSQPDYARKHKADVEAGELDCQACHTQKFCLVCHAKKAPASHAAGWDRAHGKASIKPIQRCDLCHQKNWCQSCHVLPMPHPAGFVGKHPALAKASAQLCARCHAASFCADCHRKSTPASHRQAGWKVGLHGPASAARPDYCRMCHQQQFCASCHAVTKPASHLRKSFAAGEHGKLAQKNMAYCRTCHTSQKFCDTCHTTVKPPSHDAAWMATHGKPAAAGQSNCAFCHNRSLCQKCHGSGGLKPSSHSSDYLMKHSKDAKARVSLCGLCHEATYCNGCHKAIGKPEMKF